MHRIIFAQLARGAQGSVRIRLSGAAAEPSSNLHHAIHIHKIRDLSPGLHLHPGIVPTISVPQGTMPCSFMLGIEAIIEAFILLCRQVRVQCPYLHQTHATHPFSHRRILTEVVEFNLTPEVRMTITIARDLLSTNLSDNRPNVCTQWIGSPQKL